MILALGVPNKACYHGHSFHLQTGTNHEFHCFLSNFLCPMFFSFSSFYILAQCILYCILSVPFAGLGMATAAKFLHLLVDQLATTQQDSMDKALIPCSPCLQIKSHLLKGDHRQW
jgi:hypothetical protein